ncbi:MAG: secondary thiamine-phosphate synthase enzyme YjbQ [Candidatus Jordarchaeales archaeon]|nr:secondary thiamine-phosphate synthase enzyme YjbQ [Candidatus Jordarchaeia archaeon]
MTVVSRRVRFSTKGEVDMVDVTHMVQRAVEESGLKKGIVTVFVPGSTGAVTTIEYEPGLLKDFPRMLEKIAPRGEEYEHHLRWHDWNGHSHCRAALLGPSLTVPFEDGRLQLGTWQQIVFVELDVKPRERELILQLIGE